MVYIKFLSMKIQNIQSLRGLAVLAVLFFHTMLMEKKWSGSNVILSPAWEFGQVGVDLFFVISGFVMVMITRGKFQNHSYNLKFLYSRISRIYPPYWVYSFMLLMVYLIQPALINPSTGGKVNVLASFLLLPQETLPLLMVGWTLVYEMFFYITFFIFLFFSERKLIFFLSSWIAVIALANLFYPPFQGSQTIHWRTLLMSPLSIEFILGALIARIIFSGFHRFSYPVLFTGIIFIALVFASYIVFPAFWQDFGNHHWLRLFFFGLPFSLIVYGMVSVEVANGHRMLGWLNWVGDSSYSLYLCHSITINAVSWLWVRARDYIPGGNFTLVASMICTSLVGGYLSFRILENYSARATKWFYHFWMEKFS